MTNYRSQDRNILIKEIKERDKAIKLKCFECMSGSKRQDCQTKDCPMFAYRPWVKEEINKTNYQKD